MCIPAAGLYPCPGRDGSATACLRNTEYCLVSDFGPNCQRACQGPLSCECIHAEFPNGQCSEPDGPDGGAVIVEL
jgi:hypothetical protein